MKVVIIGTGLLATSVPAAAGAALPPPDTWELVLRLLLAGLLGTLIGAEREYRAKVAGMRTHLLVSLGAALMMIVSQYGFGGHGDPSRVAAHGRRHRLWAGLSRGLDTVFAGRLGAGVGGGWWELG